MSVLCVLTVGPLVEPDHHEGRWEDEAQWVEVYLCCSPQTYKNTHTAFSPEEPEHTLLNPDNGHTSAPSYLDEKTASGCLVSKFEQCSQSQIWYRLGAK